MNGLAHLERTLGDAVATGQVGKVVSVRALLHLPGDDCELELAANTVLTLGAGLVESDIETATRASRNHASGCQASVLAHFANGRIVSVTVTRGSAERLELSLTVVGNHGVIRLEGSELADEIGLVEADFCGPSVVGEP
tara:strand:- start:1483 stop:1899 length:417 start_codon:yes stop_codon:yes gene_type:complete